MPPAAREFTEADWGELSWHDDEIHGVDFRVGNPEHDDWTSDLVLDLDHILEWVPTAGGMRFRVAPSTLVFHGVTDLRLELESGTAGQQVSLVLPSIAAIEREPIPDQRVFLDRPYYLWRIRLNGTPNGEIGFGAVGFTMTQRQDAVQSEQPRLDDAQRGAQ